MNAGGKPIDDQLLGNVPSAHTTDSLDLMRPIMGWFSEDEAKLLLAVAYEALTGLSREIEIVEVGSYYGRSTVLLANTIRHLRPSKKVTAIDPHEGEVSTSGGPTKRGPSTYEGFKRNLQATGLTQFVQVARQKSTDINWDLPIGLLFLDGLHDYDSVRKDFQHLASWVVPGGYVAIHDYSQSFPGVVRCVKEILSSETYTWIRVANDLIVLQQLENKDHPTKKAPPPVPNSSVINELHITN